MEPAVFVGTGDRGGTLADEIMVLGGPRRNQTAAGKSDQLERAVGPVGTSPPWQLTHFRTVRVVPEDEILDDSRDGFSRSPCRRPVLGLRHRASRRSRPRPAQRASRPDPRRRPPGKAVSGPGLAVITFPGPPGIPTRRYRPSAPVVVRTCSLPLITLPAKRLLRIETPASGLPVSLSRTVPSIGRVGAAT